MLKKDSVCNNSIQLLYTQCSCCKGLAVLLKMKLTIFAFAFLDQVLVLYIVVATLAEEPGPAKRRNCIIEQF